MNIPSEQLVFIYVAVYWVGVALNAFRNRSGGQFGRQLSVQRPLELLITAGWIFCYGLLIYSAAESQSHHNLYSTVVSAAVFVICLLMTQWCYKVMGSSWQVSSELDQNHQLITSGPFRICRNPIYFFQWLIFIDCTFLLNSAGVWMGAAALAVLSLLKAGIEEKVMIERFGEDYLKYRKKTRSFIPYVI